MCTGCRTISLNGLPAGSRFRRVMSRSSSPVPRRRRWHRRAAPAPSRSDPWSTSRMAHRGPRGCQARRLRDRRGLCSSARHRELEGALAIAGFPREGRSFASNSPISRQPTISPRSRGGHRDLHVAPHRACIHPRYEGGHPDHDATAFCVHRQRVGRAIAIYEMPLPGGRRRPHRAALFTGATDLGYLVEMTPTSAASKRRCSLPMSVSGR